FSKCGLINQFQLECDRQRWQFVPAFVFRNAGERSFPKKVPYPLLRIPSTVAGDPQPVLHNGSRGWIAWHREYSHIRQFCDWPLDERNSPTANLMAFNWFWRMPRENADRVSWAENR